MAVHKNMGPPTDNSGAHKIFWGGEISVGEGMEYCLSLMGLREVVTHTPPKKIDKTGCIKQFFRLVS